MRSVFRSSHTVARSSTRDAEALDAGAAASLRSTHPPNGRCEEPLRGERPVL